MGVYIDLLFSAPYAQGWMSLCREKLPSTSAGECVCVCVCVVCECMCVCVCMRQNPCFNKTSYVQSHSLTSLSLPYTLPFPRLLSPHTLPSPRLSPFTPTHHVALVNGAGGSLQFVPHDSGRVHGEDLKLQQTRLRTQQPHLHQDQVGVARVAAGLEGKRGGAGRISTRWEWLDLQQDWRGRGEGLGGSVLGGSGWTCSRTGGEEGRGLEDQACLAPPSQYYM